MKSMFSKISNSSLFNHAKRLAIVFVFLSYAAAAAAAATWNAKYTTTVKLVTNLKDGETIGAGLVYIEETNSNAVSGKSWTEYLDHAAPESDEMYVQDIKDNSTPSHKFTITIKYQFTGREGYYNKDVQGSYFAGWYSDNGLTPKWTDATNPTVLDDTSVATKEEQKTVSDPKQPHYVKFLSKTYHAKWPEVELIVFGKDGQTLVNEGDNSVTVTLGTPDNVQTGTLGGSRPSQIYKLGNSGGTAIFTQTADNYGIDGKASYTLSYSANPDVENDFFFVGWTENPNGSGASVDMTPNSGTLTTTDVYIPISDANYKEIPTTQAKKYYAVFQQYYTAHFIASNPTVAIASNSSISEAEISSSQAGTIDVPNALSCPVTYTAVSNEHASFVGWSTTEDGSNIIPESKPLDYTSNTHSYTHTYTASVDNVDANGDPIFTIPTLYAVYESFYYQPQITLVEDEGAIGYVASTSSSTYPTAEWSEGVDNLFTGEVVQVATGGTASRNVTVYFHAKLGASTSFKGWATENNENAISAGGSTEYTWNKSFTLTSKSTPQTLDAVYAFFKKEMKFYYQRAQVGVGDDSESGKVYVDVNANVTPPWNNITENTLYQSTEEDTDGNNDNILTLQNSPAFYYTYYAQPSDASKSAFVGWSSSPDVYNEVGTTNPYTAQYSASEDYNNPATPTNMYAFFRSYYYGVPHAYAEGGGKVFVSKTQVQANTISGWAEDFEDNDTKYQVPWSAQGYASYDFYFYAQEGNGSKFEGWSTSPEGTKIISKDNPYCRTSQTSSMDKNMPHRSTPLYAIFQSCLDIKQQDRMICYLDNQDKGYINDARIIIDLSEASTLVATLNNTTDFQLTNKSGTYTTAAGNPTFSLDATKGLLQLHLSYIGELNRSAVGKTAEITLTGKEGSQTIVSRTITITIEEAPIITFLPTDGKGSYTIKLTDGSGVMHTMTQTAKDNIQVAVTNETQANVEMSVTDNANDNYIFFGWRKREKDTETYISYDKTCAYTFKAAATVYPEFIPKNIGTFIIKGDPLGTVYHHLQDALDDAEIYATTTGMQQVVVFDNTFGKTAAEQVSGVLAKGQYNIPANVTLLIPGDADYNCVLGAPSELHKEEAITPSVFRKLIVEDGTIINVKGNICLYTPKICSQGADKYMARPSAYGQLEMGEKCQINLEGGAGLYAFGYITGANSSKVVAKDGSLVYELFQFTDYRGGSATGNLYAALRSEYKIFPTSQYYIQNIEIPLELYHGATEMLSAAVTMGGSVTTIEVPFIVTSATSGSGFFKLGTNAIFRKFYDSPTDRQKFEVENGSCSIDKIYLDMGTVASMIHVEIKSEEYVLPINHNMDLMLKNTTLAVPNDMAFLAGSTVLVDENSTVNISGKVYVYDSEQNNYPKNTAVGFLGAGHYKLMPITYTPSHPSGASSIRKPENLQDATWIVNGTVNVSGGLYTTAGKAAITSTKQGKINFNSTLGNANTYQAYYIGFSSDNTFGQAFELMSPGKVNEVITYPVHSASLKNAAPDSWTSTQKGNYTYNPVLGVWEKDQVTSATWTAEQIIITQPNTSKTITGKWYKEGLQSADGYTISTTSVGFSVGTLAYKDGALAIPITYAAQNKSGEHVGEILIQNGGTTHTLLVTAIEDYTPIFEVPNPCNMTAYVEASDVKEPFVVASQGNITELVTDPKMVWTPELSGVDAGQFTFAFGAGEDKLTKSKLTFKPTSAGTKNATLTLTATYTDGNGKAHTTSVAIPLVGNAKDLGVNDLAFNDLSNIYVGQTVATPLFTGEGNGNTVRFTIIDEENVDSNGNKQKVSEKDFGITADKSTSTINPKRAGTFTIIAEQPPTSSINGTTISTTITIYPRVKWNWENMYFGGTYTNPITFMDGTSAPYTLLEKTDAQNVVQYDPASLTAKISNWETGEAEATFTFKQDGYDEIVFTSKIHRDPRHLRVDVNHERTFKAVNEDTVGVQFDNLNKTIVFTSKANSTSQWTMYFIGVPDEIHFTPTQCRNAWQIEESTNGINWMTTFTWASISTNTPFTHSLLPTTRHLRITYGGGVNESEAVLSNFYITALTSVKADLNKLYVPTVTAGTSISKDVVFTYTALKYGMTLSTSDPEKFSLNTTSLPATSEDNLYQVQQVTVTSKATTETTGFLYVKTKDDQNNDKVLLEIPIQVYQSPQDLPILTASDPLERYNFVTEKTYRTTWNDDSRTIVMDNAVSNAYPFVTFYFSDSPTPGLISFNHSAGCKGTWLIEERANDEVAWTTHYITPDASNTVSQTLSDASRYVRVTYQSAYAEVINVINLAIVPTANIKITPAELVIKKGEPQSAMVRANNIDNLTITCNSSNFTWEPTDVSTWTGSGTKEANITISYNGSAAVEYATLSFMSNDIELATIKLTGMLGTLTNGETGIYTGVNSIKYELKGDFYGSGFRAVDISDAFVPSTSTPLFDYLFIFGETTTMDMTTSGNEKVIITSPNSGAGSNAKTPCYIYQKTSGGYAFKQVIDNANTSSKVPQDFLRLTNDSPEVLKVYITGFCPYASTGYTKSDEGVFFFQGGAGDKVHVYLEDCYLYSRYKTYDGHSFIDRSNGESYSEDYVRGSGGVLVFECTAQSNSESRFNVTIHTKEYNILKSHYGCFFESIVGRAYQVSSPVQIHMAGGELYVKNSYTTLNFDDKWPTAETVDAEGTYTTTKRTNGFLSLQKQVNNAPSIDLGNANTILNFNGGRIELQNAQIVSTNYKTTMAISHRSGEFGGFRLSYGMGSDDSGGTVNFNDGTTTVQIMEVAPAYQTYYLMDKDDLTTPEDESKMTSCLRCPANTHILGGSHCMMRACSDPTSKGGAPTDGDGKPLGLYKYPQKAGFGKKGGWTFKDGEAGELGLVQPGQVPDGYKVESVTPNPGKNGILDEVSCTENCDDYLNFWFDSTFEPSVNPEIDQKLSYWKTCMPYIGAEYLGYTREIGGPTVIERNATTQTELISNFLYCQIDENISNVISSGDYYAPVKNPTPSGGYESIKPTTVGSELQNYVETYDVTNPEDPRATGADFDIAGKVYYITTIPSADVWMTFTAPFDVERIYVLEAFEEEKLANYSNDRNEILKYQAAHNANFAAFFGVAMALGTDVPFESIYKDYEGWARSQDNGELKRGMKELVHYYRTIDPETGAVTSTNWADAHYYLYKNNGDWTKTDNEEVYNTHWEFVEKQENVLMKQGSTYSMFFPYCMGCFDADGKRDFWDYWSGKFLIFESTPATQEAPHKIRGSQWIGSTTLLPDPETDGHVENGKISYEYQWPFDKNEYVESEGNILIDQQPTDESLKVMGNMTFSLLGTKMPNVYIYTPYPTEETFLANVEQVGGSFKPVGTATLIQPTASFLLGKTITKGLMPVSIGRSGSIVYGNLDDSGNGTTTGGNMPTVGGGNDLFITSIAGGINIAVAAPQYVRVLSSTGALLFSGMVQTSVDVTLPANGVYVIAGENEVQKILY